MFANTDQFNNLELEKLTIFNTLTEYFISQKALIIKELKIEYFKNKSLYAVFDASVYNQDLKEWDVSNVTNMEFMFANSKFNKVLNDWDVSNVTNMRGMFQNSDFASTISSWDVSNVTNMESMFTDNTNFMVILTNGIRQMLPI